MHLVEAICHIRPSAAKPRETCLYKMRLNTAPDQLDSVQGGSRLIRTHVSGEMLDDSTSCLGPCHPMSVGLANSV
jgi:hypothetical protein